MNRIKKLRLISGITQKELALKIGITQPALSNYENGRTPNSEITGKLADFFGVSVAYLMGIEDKKKLKAEDGWRYYTINDLRLSQPMWVHDEDSEDDYVQVLSDYELKMLEECLILGETLAEQLDYLHEKYITHEIGERSYEKITRVMIECEFYVKARRPVNVDS